MTTADYNRSVFWLDTLKEIAKVYGYDCTMGNVMQSLMFDISLRDVERKIKGGEYEQV